MNGCIRFGVLQMEGLLIEAVETGGDFCGRVVNIAVEVANKLVLASVDATQYIGLDSVMWLDQDFLLAADTSCTVAFRGMQKLLDGSIALQNSSSTIDLTAAASDESSGTLFTTSAVSVHVEHEECRN